MNKNEELINPKTLSECFEHLDGILEKSEDIDWFKGAAENDAIAQSHHGLGAWIRNNWGLWKGDNELYEYLKKLGLTHADDMSGIILTSYHRHLNKKDLDLEGQINHYIEFWKKHK